MKKQSKLIKIEEEGDFMNLKKFKSLRTSINREKLSNDFLNIDMNKLNKFENCFCRNNTINKYTEYNEEQSKSVESLKSIDSVNSIHSIKQQIANKSKSILSDLSANNPLNRQIEEPKEKANVDDYFDEKEEILNNKNNTQVFKNRSLSMLKSTINTNSISHSVQIIRKRTGTKKKTFSYQKERKSFLDSLNLKFKSAYDEKEIISHNIPNEKLVNAITSSPKKRKSQYHSQIRSQINKFFNVTENMIDVRELKLDDIKEVIIDDVCLDDLKVEKNEIFGKIAGCQ